MYLARGYRTPYSPKPMSIRIVLDKDENTSRYHGVWWNYIALGPILGAALAGIALVALMGLAGWIEGL